MNFKRKNKLHLSFFVSIAMIQLISCNSDINISETQKQNYFISNIECDNHSNLTYIMVESIVGDTLFFNKQADKILKQIDENWAIGQGTNEIYLDTGKEKLFKIKTINNLGRFITITEINNFSISQPVVFWNVANFSARVFPNSKKSWSFGKILFDEKTNKFVTHLFECDTNRVSIYLAYSDNLSKWKANEKPILIPDNFKDIYWNAPNNKGEMTVTPLISDVIMHDEKYYIFVYGDNTQENTFISLLTADSLNGLYTIHKKPLLQFNQESSYSNHDVYYPKILKYKKKWLMFYTAKNKNNDEVICKAISYDLRIWKTMKENIIPRNNGWSSNPKNQLTAQVKLINDTIYLWATGTKTVKDLNKNLNKGNVQDIAIGKYYSIDGGNNYSEMKGNPIFGGNPLSASENDHVGAAFQEITLADTTYTFFHSKGVSKPYYKVKFFKN